MGSCGKELWVASKADSDLQLTVSKESGTSAYSHEEMNPANNCRSLEVDPSPNWASGELLTQGHQNYS